MRKPARSRAATVHHSRGSQLLAEWRGVLEQQQACDLLELDPASYSRFENGVRKPSAKGAFDIERLTDGAVPAIAWHQPPVAVKRSRAS
jgi:DNA-binding transcriptional regulator YdaS (Cro superfamily)